MKDALFWELYIMFFTAWAAFDGVTGKYTLSILSCIVAIYGTYCYEASLEEEDRQ